MADDDSGNLQSGNQPLRDFPARTADDTDKVVKLARKGEVHPDPQVAAMALEWAKAVLAREPLQPVVYGRNVPYLVADLAFSAGWLGNSNAPAVRVDRRQRSWAEDIVRASARHSADRDRPAAE